eukprot:scaffold370739_cov34-Prasinocladus_malaysianus.AAC.1
MTAIRRAPASRKKRLLSLLMRFESFASSDKAQVRNRWSAVTAEHLNHLSDSRRSPAAIPSQ